MEARLVAKMDVPTPPIFVIDDSDIGVYTTVEDADLHLEAIDVKEGRYVAYDKLGRLLRFETHEGNVQISLAEIVPMHTKALESVLRRYLADNGEVLGEDEHWDLDRLINAVGKFTYRPRTTMEMLGGLARKIANRFRHES